MRNLLRVSRSGETLTPSPLISLDGCSLEDIDNVLFSSFSQLIDPFLSFPLPPAPF